MLTPAAVLLSALTLIPGSIGVADPSASPLPPGTGMESPDPGAASLDTTSPDAIVAALYDVISGPAGQARDWNRFRDLFLPGSARLIGMGKNAAGDVVYRPMTPDEYVASSGSMLERDGFFEHEIGFREDRFGNVLHRFSAYAARRTPGDPAPFMRGINSIQLLFDGTRWWVVTVLWDQERADNPIPAALGG